MYGHYAPDMYGQRGSTDSARPHYAYHQMNRTPSNDSSHYQRGNTSSYQSDAMFAGQIPSQYPAFQRAQSTHQPENMRMYRHSPSHSWGGSPVQAGYSMMPPRQASVPESDENDIYSARSNELDKLRGLSLRDSGLGSDIAPGHTRGARSINSLPASDIARQTSTSEHSTSSQFAQVSRESSNSMRNQSVTSDTSPQTRRKPVPRNENDMSSDSSDNEDESQSQHQQRSESSRTASATQSTNASATTETIESADDMSRAMHAPEVVTDENRSMLMQHNARALPHGRPPNHIATIHPALRYPYNYVGSPISPEPDNPWLPLPRPAKHNNYHGFCKGAWQIRKSVSVPNGL